jgi:hypothetical protein
VAHVGFSLSFSRSFVLYELEARFEAFNALNHANFDNPGASISSSTFGRITTQAIHASSSSQ